MSIVEQSRKFLSDWNAKFPLDRIWRKAHNVSFGSEEHRKICQYQLYLDWLEDGMYEEALESYKEQKEREEQLEKGILIKERKVSKEESDKLFDKLRANFKNIKVQ